jgi:hypothetical protein
LFVKFWGTLKSFQSIESVLNAQNGAVNSAASRQIKASVDLSSGAR